MYIHTYKHTYLKVLVRSTFERGVEVILSTNILVIINGFKPNVPSWGVLWAVMDVDVLDKVGERIDQTSGYGERLLDGGLTEGLPMKLEVAGFPPGQLRCGIW